jgi:hypothetical protein
VPIRHHTRPAHFGWLLGSTLVFLAAAAGPAHAGSAPMPSGKSLTARARALDAGRFAAYNDCDLASFARYIPPDMLELELQQAR